LGSITLIVSSFFFDPCRKHTLRLHREDPRERGGNLCVLGEENALLKAGESERKRVVWGQLDGERDVENIVEEDDQLAVGHGPTLHTMQQLRQCPLRIRVLPPIHSTEVPARLVNPMVPPFSQFSSLSLSLSLTPLPLSPFLLLPLLTCRVS
jgi:hypothetical protein